MSENKGKVSLVFQFHDPTLFLSKLKLVRLSVLHAIFRTEAAMFYTIRIECSYVSPNCKW
jgi:hypothetical protein